MDQKAIKEIASELLEKYDSPNTLDKHRKEYEPLYGKDDYEKIETEFGRLWFQNAFPDPDGGRVNPIIPKVVIPKVAIKAPTPTFSTGKVKKKKKVTPSKPIEKKQKIIVSSPPKPTSSPTLFDEIDRLQECGKKVGPMSEEEILNLLKQIEHNKGKRNASYRCCGCTHHSLFDFRKHLFVCHPEEYKQYHLSKFLSQDPPTLVRGIGVSVSKPSKRKKGSARNEYSDPAPCKGDHFHIIYTPMGNKR